MTNLSNLVVDPSRLEETMAENDCESEGTQRMLELMRNSKFEVMRVYLPGAGSSDNCEWVDIGHAQYANRAEEAIVKVDREYLSHLMAKHSRLHIYHFHPSAYFTKCTDKITCGGLPVPTTPDKTSEDALISNLRYSMPSPNDIAFMMDISRQFDQHGHVREIMRHRVITPYGIADYSLTKQGMERLKNQGMEGEKGRFGFDTYIKVRISYALLEIGEIIKRNPHDILGTLKELAGKLSNEYVIVTYTPF